MGRAVRLIVPVVFENRVADGDALVADVSAGVIAGGGDQLSDYVLAFMAKRTTERIVGTGSLHGISCTKGIEVFEHSQYTRLLGHSSPGGQRDPQVGLETWIGKGHNTP